MPTATSRSCRSGSTISNLSSWRTVDLCTLPRSSVWSCLPSLSACVALDRARSRAPSASECQAIGETLRALFLPWHEDKELLGLHPSLAFLDLPSQAFRTSPCEEHKCRALHEFTNARLPLGVRYIKPIGAQ